MRSKFLPLVVALAAGAMALTIVTVGQAHKSDIFGSDHDIGSAGSPTCAQCHTPHQTEALYLWSMQPNSGYSGESSVLPLCYSCHDGSVAQSGSYIPDASHNHPQGVMMYDPNDDGDMSDAYPITEHASYETSCKKCMEPDCIKCHDAHSGAWAFLDRDRFEPIDTDGDDIGDTATLNASLCLSCHEGWRHGIESYDTDHNPMPHTTHPEMISEPEGAEITDLPSDRSWVGDAADFSGNRLWTDDTVYTNLQGAGDTERYVVSSGPGDVRCMTCHTAHGAQNEELTSMAVSEESAHSPICENCHQ